MCYIHFVSDALTQENQNNLHAVAKGRKWAAEVGASGSSHSRSLVAVRPQFRPQHLTLGLPRRTPRLADLRRYFTRHSPLPCPRVTQAKEAQQGQEVTRHASIAIRWATGPKSAPILKRVVIRIKATKSKPILKHVLGMCIV